MENILITGASSGIGKAFAYEFAKINCTLILVARRENVLNEIGCDLQKKYGTKSIIISQDLSEPGAADRIVKVLNDKNISINTLVNNAGFATKGLLHHSDYEMQRQEINVNITALTELTYLLIENMENNGGGTIINVASAASFNPIPYNAVYAATKAYVLSFTQSISFEYRKRNVKAVAVCPQATDTHFFDNFDKMKGKMRAPEDVVRTALKAVKHNKTVAPDGLLCHIQAAMPHLLPRKICLKITGQVGENTWYN